jgi:hypothetical protein
VTGNKLIDPSGKSIRLTGFNWPLEHVHDGDGQMMLDKMPAVNVARIVGVLWDNSPSKSDCYTDTSPFFKESCFGKLDAAVKAATDAKIWVILAARCKFAAGDAYETDPMANVFHNKTLSNMLYVAWEHVAKHYASWDYIGAYEVMAEPRDKGVSATTIRSFYEGACSAVQSVDSNTPCMVGPGPYYKIFHFDANMLLANKNVIYTFDYFIPDSWSFGRDSIPVLHLHCTYTAPVAHLILSRAGLTRAPLPSADPLVSSTTSPTPAHTTARSWLEGSRGSTSLANLTKVHHTRILLALHSPLIPPAPHSPCPSSPPLLRFPRLFPLLFRRQ